MSDTKGTAFDNEDFSEQQNNILVTGSVMAALTSVRGLALEADQVVDAAGNPTNVIEVTFSFMKSPYRLTIERVKDKDQ